MTNRKLGSYSFGEFNDNEFELSRLTRQAKIAWQIEKPYLLKHGLKRNHNMVDFACGPGVVTNLIHQEIVTQGNVVGVELNDTLHSVSIKMHSGPNAPSFLLGDVYEPRCLGSNEFDFAYARFLFQHLSEPARALNAVYEKLKPGGRFAILDVDDGLFSFTPEVQGLEEFLLKANAAQAALGGNRQIGRKLAELLCQCGYKDIQIDVVPISTVDLGGDDFIDITTKFKLTLLSSDEQEIAKSVIKEMASSIKDHNGFGVTYVFIVSGRK